MKLFNKDESKKRLQILKELQSLPLKEKISISLGEFKKLKDCVFLAMFSYGKDSLCIKHLAEEANIKANFLYCETGMEIDKVDKIDSINHRTHGEDIFKIWEDHSCYPILSKMSSPKYKRKHPGIRISSGLCCYHIKEKPAIKFAREIESNVVIWGNKASDSNRRKFHFVDYGFVYKSKNQRLQGTGFYPLQHWLDKDVKKYLSAKGVDIKINRLETGCKYCASDFNKNDNNLQNLLRSDRQSFDKLMKSGFGEQICKIKNLNFAQIDNILGECPMILTKYK